MTPRSPRRIDTQIRPRFDATALAIRIIEHQVNKEPEAPKPSPVITDEDTALLGAMDFGDVE